MPTVAYPAASSRATDSAVRSGTCSANTIEPYVVTSPAVSNRSLTASGSRPRAAPGGRGRSTPDDYRPSPERRLCTSHRTLPANSTTSATPDQRRAGSNQPGARRPRAQQSAEGVEAEEPTIELELYELDNPRPCDPTSTDCSWQGERKPSDANPALRTPLVRNDLKRLSDRLDRRSRHARNRSDSRVILGGSRRLLRAEARLVERISVREEHFRIRRGPPERKPLVNATGFPA